MATNSNERKQYQKLLELACKGTSVTTKELLRELVNSGYKKVYGIDLSLDDLKSVVEDLVDGKEIAALSSKTGRASSEVEISN